MTHACDWWGSHKLPFKNNIQVVYMHTRLTMNGIVKDFLEERDS
jgi:hypothetical protein